MKSEHLVPSFDTLPNLASFGRCQRILSTMAHERAGSRSPLRRRRDRPDCGVADSRSRYRFWLPIAAFLLLIVSGVIFLLVAKEKLTSIGKVSDQAPASRYAVSATDLVIATGEHELDDLETNTCIALIENVRRAGLNQVVERGSRGAKFWSDGQAFGATGTIAGKFCEFYISDDAYAQTIWFRNTNGAKQEFPREQVMFRFEKESKRAVVASGVYFKEGSPVWMPKESALERIKKSEEKWLEALQTSLEASEAN